MLVTFCNAPPSQNVNPFSAQRFTGMIASRTVNTNQRAILTANVVKLAKARNTTPSEFAKAAGRSRPWASMVFKGVRNVTLNQWRPLATFYNVDPDALMREGFDVTETTLTTGVGVPSGSEPRRGKTPSASTGRKAPIHDATPSVSRSPLTLGDLEGLQVKLSNATHAIAAASSTVEGLINQTRLAQSRAAHRRGRGGQAH